MLDEGSSPVTMEAVSLETEAACVMVDKVASFQEVQSPLLQSQRLVSAAVGLNHTALVTGEPSSHHRA